MEYFQQEKDYTCGCASVRMVLSCFENEVPSESELEKALKTNDRIGTHPDAIVEYFQNLNYDVTSGDNATYEMLQKLMEYGYKIILLVSVDVPHVTVVKKINDCHISFFDPFYGRISKEKRKFSSEKQIWPHYRWRIVASEFKKYAPDYDFTVLESKNGYIAIKK